jgi:hypothetical protein
MGISELMVDTSPEALRKLPAGVGEALRDLGCTEKQMPLEMLLHKWLEWQGVIGWTSAILRIVEAAQPDESFKRRLR